MKILKGQDRGGYWRAQKAFSFLIKTEIVTGLIQTTILHKPVSDVGRSDQNLAIAKSTPYQERGVARKNKLLLGGMEVEGQGMCLRKGEI